MSKRRKPTRLSPRNKGQRQQVTLESATSSLNGGHYREAIAQCKELLKTDPKNQEVTARLAEAYEGRARQLEAKGMVKEAFAIWENRSQLAGAPDHHQHIALAFRLGRFDQLLKRYRDSTNVEPHALRIFREHLAAQYLGGATGFEQQLADDDPVLIHGSAARNALIAYCDCDDTKLQETLAKIPFRSPYRDFVQVLKALVNAEQASSLLEKIPDSSAFANLRDAVRLSLSPARTLPSALQKAGPNARALVFALQGWPPSRQALWLECLRLGEVPSAKALRTLMKRHRQALGDRWVESHDLRLQLIEQAPSRWAPRGFGNPGLDLQACHLDAVHAESDKEPWDAAQAWEEFAALLLDQNAMGDPVVTARHAAAALRRPEYCFEILSQATGQPDPESLEEQLLTMLERSLEYDPEDIECHLRLIRHYRGCAQLKEARRILALALPRWPKDKSVLTEAMETALAGNAYKKAASIAGDILAIDPINSSVRERLVAAYLAHAQKHLRGNRPDLAEKSLAEAASWAQSEFSCQRIDLARGFVALATDPEGGKKALSAVAERLGGGLTARFVLSLEAETSRNSVPSLLKKLNLHKSPKIERHDLLGFLDRLRAHLDAGGDLSFDIREHLSKLLKQAVHLDLEKADVESACETLRRAKLDDIRTKFAQAALRRWPNEPVFDFHMVDAKGIEYGPWEINDADINRLISAQDRARDIGDMRLVQRISELLYEFDTPFGIGPFGAPTSFAPEPMDSADPPPIALLEEIVRTIGGDNIETLLKDKSEAGAVLREIRRALGKAVFNSIVARACADIDGEGLNTADEEFPRAQPKRKPGRRQRSTADDELPDQWDLFE